MNQKNYPCATGGIRAALSVNLWRRWSRAFLGATLLGPLLAQAEVYDWTSTTGSTWSDAANWSPAGGPPGAADTVNMHANDLWQRVFTQNAEVYNFVADATRMPVALNKTTTLRAGNAAVATLTVHNLMDLRGGTTIYFRNNDLNSQLSVAVKDLMVDNKTVYFGITAAADNQHVQKLTVGGTFSIGAGSYIGINSLEKATLGRVDISGGALTLNNAMGGHRDHLAFGLSGTGGAIQTTNSINAEQTRTTTLEIATAEGQAYNLGGAAVIRDKNSGAGTATLNIVKTGQGTQQFSSANTYSGSTEVNEGVLLVTNVSGSATGSGDVIVQTGGMLAGDGIIDGEVFTVSSGEGVAQNGHLSPGNGGVGILTINNNLTLDDNTWLYYDVTETGSDLIIVNGDLSIGAAMVVALSGSLAIGDYRLFDYSGDLFGEANLATWMLAGAGSQLDVAFEAADNSIFMRVHAVPEPAAFALVIAAVVLFAVVRRRSRS